MGVLLLICLHIVVRQFFRLRWCLVSCFRSRWPRNGLKCWSILFVSMERRRSSWRSSTANWPRRSLFHSDTTRRCRWSTRRSRVSPWGSVNLPQFACVFGATDVWNAARICPRFHLQSATCVTLCFLWARWREVWLCKCRLLARVLQGFNCDATLPTSNLARTHVIAPRASLKLTICWIMRVGLLVIQVVLKVSRRHVWFRPFCLFNRELQYQHFWSHEDEHFVYWRHRTLPQRELSCFLLIALSSLTVTARLCWLQVHF